MPRNTNTNTNTNDTNTNDTNALQDGFSADGIAHGYTVANLVERVQTGALATWYAVAFIAAHMAAKVKRDTVLMRLVAGGIAPDVASEFIGATEGAYSQRRTAVAVLRHAGVDLTDAAAFDSQDVKARLMRVSWTTTYAARDAVTAQPEGAKAWNALVAFTEHDKTARQEVTTAARMKVAKVAEAKAEAAKRHAEAVPADAPDEVKAEAERAVKEATKEAERATKRAAKAANASSATKADAAHSVEFTAQEYKAVVDALDTVNALRKNEGKGRGTLRIGTFLVDAAQAYATALIAK